MLIDDNSIEDVTFEFSSPWPWAGGPKSSGTKEEVPYPNNITILSDITARLASEPDKPLWRFGVKGCMIPYKSGADVYGVDIVTIGFPEPFYKRLASEAARQGLQVDMGERTTQKRGSRYYTDINLKRADMARITKYYEKVGDETRECVTRPLNVVIAAVKKTLECAVTGHFRLKKHGPSADVHAMPWSLGVAVEGLVLTSVAEGSEDRDDTLDGDLDKLLAGTNLLSAMGAVSVEGPSCAGSLDGAASDRDTSHAASLWSIEAARERIAPFAHKTPVVTSSALDAMAGRQLFFKCENLQKMGAFKFRGACNAVFSLTEEEARRGVVTHSSGNHAAALALAAQLRGIPAHIVIPEDAPACKLDNVRRAGGRVVFCRPDVASREAVAAEVEAETGAVLIAPFNDARVISGQGTTALEFLEQVPNLDAIVVPVSGCGLISGMAVAAKALRPELRIIAAEPEGADDVFRSKREGRLLTCPRPETIADGLRASMGSLTWPIVRDLVDEVVLVEEREIAAAMRLCFEVLKAVVEPSGAVGLAAVLSPAFRTRAEEMSLRRVGVVLTGGNVDMGALWASLPS